MNFKDPYNHNEFLDFLNNFLPEDFNEKFQEKFKGVIESTLLQYGQKE